MMVASNVERRMYVLEPAEVAEGSKVIKMKVIGMRVKGTNLFA